MLVVAFIIVYMVPTIIAVHRKHAAKWAIVFVNVLLGWTLVGYVWALIWALAATHNHSVNVVINNKA